MNELKEFLKKCTSKYSGISYRKLYGLDSFYLNDKPFLLITAKNEIVLKIEDFEVRNKLKVSQIIQWKLDEKIMENWFLLPERFNKKKNKLMPILEMTSTVLLNPKKEKIKRNKKKLSKSKLINTLSESHNKANEKDIEMTFIKSLFNKFK